MKKVLIITHIDHATPRIPGISRYLSEFGWEPIIISPTYGQKVKENSYRIVETAYKDKLKFIKYLSGAGKNEDVREKLKSKVRQGLFSKLMDHFVTVGGSIILYPDDMSGWAPYAMTAASDIIEKEDIRAIVSSSSPVTSHLIANRLKAKYDIPWIAELRDLWSQNHNYGWGPIRKIRDKNLELNTFKNANALVTVDPPCAENLKTLHKRNDVYVITNGFDPNILNIPPVATTQKFTITYTGTVYREKQDPIILLEALRQLIKENTIDPLDMDVRFYSVGLEWLNEYIQKYKLSESVKIYDKIPFEESLKRQRESQMLALFTWEGDVKFGYPLKTFEYMASQRPILATGGGNDLTKDLIAEASAGHYCKDIPEIKQVIKDAYKDYKTSGAVHYYGNSNIINKYNYRELAKNYTNLLNKIIE